MFTDIEGSTRRWDAQPDAMREALARHDALLWVVPAVEVGRNHGHDRGRPAAAWCAAPTRAVRQLHQHRVAVADAEVRTSALGGAAGERHVVAQLFEAGL